MLRGFRTILSSFQIPQTMNKLLLSIASLAVAASASATDYYIIGENVNGQRWATSQADAKFTETATAGVYEWKGVVLGTGFKINDGGWSNPDCNIGGNGSPIAVDVPYTYTTGGTSPNIIFAEGTEIENPVVELNTNNKTLTIKGAASGNVAWYLMGTDEVWDDWSDSRKFVETTEGSGVFQLKNFNISAAGNLKVSNNGWGEQYGTNTGLSFSASTLSNVLEPVYGESGEVPYTMTGAFDVEWNYNTKTLSFTTVGQQTETTYYLIGAGVNGHSWQLADESAKFVKTGTGVYEVKVNSLLSAFKVNDGTWSNDQANIGSNGQNIELGTPYKYGVGGVSGNITFADITEVTDATVPLNTNDMTITVVGTPVTSEKEWYIVGINDPDMTFKEECKMTKNSDGIYQVNMIIEGEGSFKISTLNWAEQYGMDEEKTQPITDTNLSTTLGVVSIDAAVPYNLSQGNYMILWDYNTKMVTFIKAIDGVDGITADEGEPEYFTLQGVRVAQPEEGIYIVRKGGKSTKEVIRK